MKKIILSADGPFRIYEVPDEAADRLEEYCLRFTAWLKKSPDAAEYRRGRLLIYNEADFIDYLNRYVFPGAPCRLVGSFSRGGGKRPESPPEYRDCPRFDF